MRTSRLVKILLIMSLLQNQIGADAAPSSDDAQQALQQLRLLQQRLAQTPGSDDPDALAAPQGMNNQGNLNAGLPSAMPNTQNYPRQQIHRP